MDDILKNNKFILTLILLLGFGLRFWDMNNPTGLWHDEYTSFTIKMFDYPFNFFHALKTNCYAPLHYFYFKLWANIFRNSDFILNLSTLIPNLSGCLVLYYAGKNYQTKESSTKIGLFCALIGAISSLLIYFCQEVRIYSLTFLLTTLVLLFSVKSYEFPSKKHYCYLTLFSVLLILEHTISVIYIIFNTFALIAFKQKHKKKNKEEDNFLIPILSGLILCLPLIPFLFRMFAHPTYISQWWSPFDWSKIFFYFTDIFSPVLRNITVSPTSFHNQIIINNNINAGFIIFALICAGIMVGLIIRAATESKRIDKYLLCTCLSTFLTLLITAIIGKMDFITKYYIELYPALILLSAIGWAKLNSSNTRIMLLTIYVFLTLFYIVVTQISSIKLI